MSRPSDFQLKQGDTSTRLFKLTEPDGTPEGRPFDLTGYAPGDLAFFFELETVTPIGSVLITGAGTFVIIDAEAGHVTYTFAAADTGVVAGLYRGEIEALLPPARNTFPQDDYFLFDIVADLGDQ